MLTASKPNCEQISEERVSTKMDSSSNVRGDFPDIIPCCYGKEIGVDAEIISTGLSAISIKRQTSKKQAVANQMGVQKVNNFENRNSFFNLHRPEMTKINWVSTSPKKIEQFFHDHATKHGPFCEYLHNGSRDDEDELTCLLPASGYKYNEEESMGVSDSIGNSVLLKSISMQLSDEDLSPSSVCHRSRAEFCMTIGGKEVPRFTRTMSQTTADPSITSSKEDQSHRGSLPKYHEQLLSPLPESEVDKKKADAITDYTTSTAFGRDSTELASISPKSDPKLMSPILSPQSSASETASLTENPSFREILQPRGHYHTSQLNLTTQADEDKISKNQQATQEAVTKPPGKTYQKMKPRHSK